MIISFHAIERYKERINPYLDDESIRKIIRSTIEPLLSMMDNIDGQYPLGNGFFAAYQDGWVVTVKPKDRLQKPVRKKNGNKNFQIKNFILTTEKSFTALKCFLIRQVKFIWAMLEITQ